MRTIIIFIATLMAVSGPSNLTSISTLGSLRSTPKAKVETLTLSLYGH